MSIPGTPSAADSRPPQSPAAPLLAVRDLTVEFATRAGRLRAVSGVDYDLPSGQTLGIVGESGSGKSVSALALLRLLPEPPTCRVEGSIVFDGQDLLSAPTDALRRVRGGEIGMIFQDPMTSLNPVLSIGRQISESLRLHRDLGARAARRRVIDLLGMVGIPDTGRRVDEYPHQLSGGMRQRAMIAMAVSCEPKLLIADEPTTALDVTIQAQIFDLLRRLRADTGMSIILITHDLGLVAGFADHLAVMYAGKMVETGPVERLLSSPRHHYTRGLLNSVPRLDRLRGVPLTPIPGLPPTMTNLPAGCSFQPRCQQWISRCVGENPPLEPMGDGRQAACWHPIPDALP